LNQEHCKERHELFTSMQEFEREAMLYKSIIHKGGFLTEAELGVLVGKCTYDEDRKQWGVPKFMKGDMVGKESLVIG
jgi:hypothetical protein